MPHKKNSITNKYKPTQEEQDTLKHVYQRYYEMQEAPERKKMEKEWENGEKAWEAFVNEEMFEDWQSDYYIPLTTSVVESILSEFVEQRIRPLILPRSDEDRPRAKVMQHAYNYTWDVADGDMELMHVLKGTFIRGTGIGQEYFLQDRRVVRDIIGLNQSNKSKKKFKFETEEREVFEFNGCMMENVSLWDVYVDEKAREFNRGPYKARDVIRRYVLHIDDFKRFFSGPMWDPMNNARLVRPGGDTDYYQFFKPPQGIDHSKDVEVLWYWSRSPEDQLVIVANDVVIRMGPSIFKHKQLPFAKAVDIARMEQFYGKGEPKLLESIQEELNTIRRMTIDRHHLDLDKSFLVSNTSLLDSEDAISQPHNIIEVDDPSNVQSLEYGDIPASVRFTQQSIVEDSIRATGIDDRFQSLQKAPSTATEAAILKESTLKRIQMKITMLTEGFLKDISRQRVANILQFYSQPKIEKIVGSTQTMEFRREMANLAREGKLVIQNGKPFKRKFPEIRIENKKLDFDERGEIVERNINDFSFFELRPEHFMPVSEGGFDVKFDAGSTLPISKPLMQSKANEMFDRIMTIAEPAGYDATKIADWLVKVHDYNPQDFKSDEENEKGAVSQNRVQMAVNLANREHQELISNDVILENGTPYAPPVHTEIHIAFLRSETMQQAPQDQFEKLSKHALGEILAQQARQGGNVLPQGGQQQQQVAQQGRGVQAPTGQNPNNELGSIMQDRMQGSQQVPSGLPFGPSR